MRLKHTREYYLKFFLFFVLVFFIITYGVLNKETLSKQLEIVTEGSIFFAKTATKETIGLKQEKIGSSRETYEIEFIIHEQINKVRIENELKPLQWDPVLSKIARNHSLEMSKNRYLNHTNLKGENPTDRAKKAGLKTRIFYNGKIYNDIGENIGFMPKGIVENYGVLILEEDIASAMVLEWLLSDRHKENILETDYQFGGIGVSYDGNGNYYITHNFQ